MPEKQKIFLSAVSGQFKDCRDALRSDLAAVDADVVVQEDFQQGPGTLLEKLEQYIASCDRVIALVGSAYGWQPEPAAKPKDAPNRSYTQWEYYFAMGERLDGSKVARKDVYVYFATPDYLEQHTLNQSNAETVRQQRFIEEIETSGKDRNEFDSIDKLARLVLRDGFQLSKADEILIQNLPYDSLRSLFKGRDNFITALKEKLSADTERATAIVAKQAIHGLGGVGKTRLAVEYAWNRIADYSACLFVIADSPENLERNLAELCKLRALKLTALIEQTQDEQVAGVMDWLNAHAGWLLILDSVDSPEAAAAVQRLLPKLQRGHVLITSRRTDWGNSVHAMGLDTLENDDAVAFLLEKTTKRTDTENDEEAALTLAKTLGGLALALEQAGAFINKYHNSFEQYQQRWEQQEAKLLEFQVKDYPKSLAITWETSFKELTPDAQMLLNILSWFAPEPIPREDFESAFNTYINELRNKTIKNNQSTVALPDLEDLLAELENLSLLKWEIGNHSFSVHRLVQEITQERMSEEQRSGSLRLAVELINAALLVDLPPDDVRSWPIWDPLRPHLEYLIDIADRVGITDPTSRLMNEFGQYLKVKCLFRQAEPLMRRSLVIDEVSFGAEHPKVAIRLNNLALLLQATNRLAEAEPLMRRALAIDEANYGAEHPKIAIRLNNLATLLSETNRLTEAEPLMLHALAIDEASYGAEHPNVATDLNNLATLLQATNRLAEAEPLIRRALAIDEASFGAEHPVVAIRLNNLAQLLKDTNRLAEAEPLMRRALDIDETNYGDVHPKVAIRLNNLAQLLKATGRFSEAEPLMRRVLAIDKASYGSEHPDVARDLNNIATLLIDTNRLTEAEPLMRRVVEILMLFNLRTGHEHPHLNTVIENYRIILSEIGHDEKEAKAIIDSLIESVKHKVNTS